MSVIVATYNSASYIETTLAAIRGQTYGALDIVVTDDASSDATPAILENARQDDGRIRWFRQAENTGAARARNNSLRNARGRFVAFCDADDVWAPDKIERQMTFMVEERAAVSFTAFEIIDADGARTGRLVDLRGARRVGYEDMLRKRATMGCSTVMVDRRRTGALEMPDLRTGQDYATWLKLLRAGHVAHRLPAPLTRYRITPGSISRNKVLKALRQWEIYRHFEGLGFLKATWCFAHYACRAGLRQNMVSVDKEEFEGDPF